MGFSKAVRRSEECGWSQDEDQALRFSYDAQRAGEGQLRKSAFAIASAGGDSFPIVPWHILAL